MNPTKARDPLKPKTLNDQEAIDFLKKTENALKTRKAVAILFAVLFALSAAGNVLQFLHLI